MAYRKDSLWKTVDWWTIALYMVLIVCGWFSVCGASYDYGDPDFLNFTTRAGKQLMWIGCSLTLGFVLLMLEERLYDTYAYLIYGILLLLLFGTIFNPHEIKGSRSWIVLGPVSLQPAEFAKFATALALAKYMGEYTFSIERGRNTPTQEEIRHWLSSKQFPDYSSLITFFTEKALYTPELGEKVRLFQIRLHPLSASELSTDYSGSNCHIQ